MSAKEAELSKLIYKILTSSQWDIFARSGQFGGSEHDLSDGFIHMCSGPQLQDTLDKHYATSNEIILVGFDESSFDHELKWEISRGGEKFPHFYSDLPFSALVNVHRLAQTQKGGFVLPRAIG